MFVVACSDGFGSADDGGSDFPASTAPTDGGDSGALEDPNEPADNDDADNDDADNDDADNDDADNDDADNDDADNDDADNDDAESGESADEEILAKLGQLQGQLAIGNGPEVSVARPDGLSATPLDGSETTLAAQPTWSRDGLQLAWSSVAADRQVIAVQPFDEEGLPSADRVESNATGSAIYYLQWNHDNTRLAYLRPGTRGRQVEFGIAELGRVIDPVGAGTPFFFSWSPSSEKLAANVNQNSLDIVDAADGAPAPRALLELNGQFSAPVWVDESTVLAIVDDWFVTLDVTDGSVEQILDVGGAARFVLSPDRLSFAFQSPEATQSGVTQAAYQDQTKAPAGLIVVDLATGEQTKITTEVAVSWEWSPDSKKLAWLSAEGAISRPEAHWNFWSRAASEVVTTMTPTLRLPRKATSTYLPFFAQYSQSVTRWGPDSSAFVFEGIIDGRSGIWMQLVGPPSTAVPVDPQLVASGDFVTWGYGPTPDPVVTGGPSPT